MNLFYYLLVFGGFTPDQLHNIMEEMNNDGRHTSRSIQLVLYYIIRAICIIGLVICFIILIYGLFSNNNTLVVSSLVLGCISGCVWLIYVVSKEKEMIEDTTLRKYIT